MMSAVESWPFPAHTEDTITRTPAEVTRRVKAGHTVIPDKPPTLTALRQWSCTRCGDVVWQYGVRVWGKATERECGGGESP